MEPLCARRTLDDTQGPETDSLQFRFQFGADISTVGEDMTQTRKGMADGGENAWGAVAVLDVGGVNPSGE